MKKKVVSAVATAAILSCAYAGTTSASSYTVQKGDTLSHIALKYQTSVLDLKKFNSLPSDFLRINQVLQVDSAAPTVVQPAVPASGYTIVSGDTLGRIASKFNISLADLMKWNNLNSSLIFPGTRLKVSAGTAAPTDQPATDGSTPVTVPSPSPSLTEYVIKSGDTLGALALQFGSTVSQLKQLNQLSSDLIYVGQKLHVTGGTAPATAPVVVPVVAPPTQAPVAGSTDYIVQSGDTLGRIAAQFDVTVSSIKKLNNLSSDLIYVGQTMKIAGVAVPTGTPSQLSNLATAVIQEARNLMGVPYVWGGSSNSGFDCSGFIYYVYNKAGFSTSRYNAAGFYSRSHYVDQPQAGDLVFFENTYKKGISHVGIYLGDNQFIHADEDRGIAITNLNSSYFKAHLDGFKRFY
jgi:LysM repeat protein